MQALKKLAAGPGHLALVDVARPTPGPGHVLVEVHAAGICGTDLHIEAGEYPVVAPVTLGHEVSGVVAGLGDGVDPSWTGCTVVAETFFSTCATCEQCRAGRPNLCPSRRSIGTHVDGAFAEALVVPVTSLHPVPAGLDRTAAALIEPLACVCRCLLEPVVVGPGQRALVTGPGAIGILAAQVLRAAGADVVLAGAAGDGARLAVARDLGLATVEVPSFDSAFDVVVEASGSQTGAGVCLESARPGGTYVQIGLFGRPVALDLDRLVFKELVTRAGFATVPSSWRAALRLVAEGKVELAGLVSRMAPLADWEVAFADLRARRALKIVLDPRRP